MYKKLFAFLLIVALVVGNIGIKEGTAIITCTQSLNGKGKCKVTVREIS